MKIRFGPAAAIVLEDGDFGQTYESTGDTLPEKATVGQFHERDGCVNMYTKIHGWLCLVDWKDHSPKAQRRILRSKAKGLSV
jgi:hypothetical protein